MLSNKAMGAAKAVEPAYVEDVFSTYLYTGNGATQTINNGIDLAGKGGLVWFKPRNTGNNHNLIDSARGLNKFLITNSTAAEGTTGVGYGVASFNSNGFSLNPPWTSSTNTTDTTQVAWTFRKQPKFFDVQTFTSNSGYSATVNHNLGSVPGCVIIKTISVNNGEGWYVYHRSVGTSAHLVLNTTATQAADSPPWITLSSTQISFNSSLSGIGQNYVAYIFAHDAGGFGLSGTESVINCGSFTTGSGYVDVELGWEPQFLLIKTTSINPDFWRMYDTSRGWSHAAGLAGSAGLQANTTAIESADVGNSEYFYPTATGFRVFQGGPAYNNTPYIYIAIRRGPMKVPTDGTKVFMPAIRTGTGAVGTVSGVGFPPDLYIGKSRDGFMESAFIDRLRGNTAYLAATTTNAELSAHSDGITGWTMDGYTVGADTYGVVNSSNFSRRINWNFRRAPSFFDVVCYTGTGVANYVKHNLGVAPELMIVKNRSTSADWFVAAKTYRGFLNTTAAMTNDGWNHNAVDLGGFGSAPTTNAAGSNYVAYVFATCPGVSKVGSYTGTGTTQAIACGFTAGARFVMIKRTDSTGDWYVWDSARGIVAGNDPYLLMNSTAAEVTSTDYIDPSSAGFEISSTAPAAINASGGSYIFLAVA